MRAFPVLFTLVLCLVLSTVATAADLQELMMKDGMTAMVEVVTTEPESVTVKFKTKDGKVGETKLHAAALDPHSFYEIRKGFMEKTAENHVKLAVWCAGAGLFSRAKRQMGAARALDPKVDEKMKDMPDVQNGISNYLADKARRAYKAGQIQQCYEIAVLIATRFPETEGGVEARGVLEQLKEETEAAAEAKDQAREAKIEAEQDEEKKKAARANDHILDSLEKKLSMAQNLMHSALKERNQSRARRTYEQAAVQLTGLLKQIDTQMKSAKDNAELLADLVELDATVRNEAVAAWVAAGNVLLARGSQKDAMRCAQEAIALDADSESAKSFMNSVQMASAMSGWGRWR